MDHMQKDTDYSRKFPTYLPEGRTGEVAIASVFIGYWRCRAVIKAVACLHSSYRSHLINQKQLQNQC